MTVFEEWLGVGAWADVATVLFFAALAAITYVLVRLALPMMTRAARRSRRLWDDIILDKKSRHRVSLLGPALLLYAGIRLVADDTSPWTEFLFRLSTGLLILLGSLTISAVLRAANVVYETKPISQDRPIEPYIQVAEIIVYLFAGILIVAVLADLSPWFFVSGLGAMTAVLLLIFKDTILSFVASIQLIQQDMVDVGDWIQMHEFDADGPVIDVALHTITVQNFDKTITTIPTYKLISESFRNWRGVTDAGLRRIKRSILIDQSTIRFLTEEEIERFSRFEPLENYIGRKRTELAEADQRQVHLPGRRRDRRRLTNIGTFRAYILEYVRGLDVLDTDDSTCLVRQLQPSPDGLPLEIYAFTRTADWAAHEDIQSDVFDHILAMVPEFDLKLFQNPTGDDVRNQATSPSTFLESQRKDEIAARQAVPVP